MRTTNDPKQAARYPNLGKAAAAANRTGGGAFHTPHPEGEGWAVAVPLVGAAYSPVSAGPRWLAEG